MNDYYNLLGVRFAAKPDEIRSAFRREAKLAHPDTNPGLTGKAKEEMHQRFIQLAQAYETLSDPERRKEYDRLWRAHQQARQRTQSRADTARPRPSATGQKTSTAGQARHATAGTRPQRPQPQQAQPDMGEMLDEVEELLGRFGVDMRNQFGVMLDKMLDWALTVFMEVMQNLEAERANTRAESTNQSNAGARPQATGSSGTTAGPQPKPRPRPEPRATEQDLDAELAALKNQINSAMHKAKREQEESVEEELARIKAATRPKS